MSTAASDFTSSPAGWVIVTLVVLLIGLLGWLGRGVFHRLDKQDATLGAHTTALAVIVEQIRPGSKEMDDIKERLNGAERDLLIMITWRESLRQPQVVVPIVPPPAFDIDMQHPVTGG